MITHKGLRALFEIPGAEGLRGLLDELNESGVGDTVAGIDADGQPFLALLWGPYAESDGAQLGYPWDGETEIHGAEHPCGECNAAGPVPLDQLRYPVVVIR